MTYIESPKKYAGCPLCGHPLVQTFEFKFKEWICMGCAKVWEYLSAKTIEGTPEVVALYDQARAQYARERKAREKAGTAGRFHPVKMDWELP